MYQCDLCGQKQLGREAAKVFSEYLCSFGAGVGEQVQLGEGAQKLCGVEESLPHSSGDEGVDFVGQLVRDGLHSLHSSSLDPRFAKCSVEVIVGLPEYSLGFMRGREIYPCGMRRSDGFDALERRAARSCFTWGFSPFGPGWGWDREDNRRNVPDRSYDWGTRYWA